MKSVRNHTGVRGSSRQAREAATELRVRAKSLRHRSKELRQEAERLEKRSDQIKETRRPAVVIHAMEAGPAPRVNETN